MNWNGIPVLVSGGAGFMGSNLATRLHHLGARVTVVDNFDESGGAHIANLAEAPGIRVLRGSIGDPALALEALRDSQIVFNLAGATGHAASMTDPMSDLETNVACQIRFLDAVRSAGNRPHVIYTSTRQVYGRPTRLPVDEGHPLAPPDANGIHKLAAEFYHRLYTRVYGIPTTILRFSNVYGPRLRIRDARQSFLGWWINRLLNGAPIEVWDGTQRRDLLHADDASNALLACAGLDGSGRVFNVGGSAPILLADLANQLAAMRGGEVIVKEMPPAQQSIDVGNYVSDTRAIGQATDWAPSVALAEGLEGMVSFYEQNRAVYLE